jgi:hypothetical protein
MSPCSPNDVSIPIPEFPSGPGIPGLGIPFSLNTPNLFSLPSGFPEDLLDIFNKLQFLIPPGAFKPQLSLNFGKTIFDGILKVLDQVMPFLMLYKFFLPVLNLIICIIEVICSIPNPEKTINALIRLFRNCIPEFLNIFPVFAIIIMIISLLLLLLSLIEYVVQQILKLVELIIKNLQALDNAISYADAQAISAIAFKLGASLCIFQNLFVLFELFNIIIQTVKDILALTFAIPPCDTNNTEGCCTTDVCPDIVKTQYTRITGNFSYINNTSERWQLFDTFQTIEEAFINIVDAYDINLPPNLAGLAALGVPVKPIFFPTDAAYNQDTPGKQAAYNLDLRLLYNPADWGRIGETRYVRFQDCVMLVAPSTKYINYDGSIGTINNGVVSLVGGVGFEDDGVTPLTGFAPDGVTPLTTYASLNNFFHSAAASQVYFTDIEYIFKPNIPVLVGKGLITAGCAPELALNKGFINTAFAGDAAVKLQELRDLLNSDAFPDILGAQECLTTAVVTLRNNLNQQGVAEFQSVVQVCLDKLQNDTVAAVGNLIGLGVDPCKSLLTAAPTVQFTTKPIKVSVDLREKNGVPIAVGIPSAVATDLSTRLKAYPTLGTVSEFAYDGYQYFTADLTSSEAGSGQLMVSFDNNILCVNNISADINVEPTRDLQQIDYQFIRVSANVAVAEGDTSDGKPRREPGDLTGGNTKDGV